MKVNNYRPSGSIYILAIATTLSTLLIVPLIPNGFGNLILADLFFIVSIIYTIIVRNNVDTIHRGARSIIIILIAFVVFSFLSFSFAQFKYQPNPSEFITVSNYIYGALISVTIIYAVGVKEDIEMLMKAWIIGAIILSLISFIAIIGLAPSWAYHHRRISSTMRSVNQVQSYLAPAMIIMLFYIYISKNTIWFITSIIGIFLSSIAMLATGSRSPILLMGILFSLAVLWAIVSFRRNPWLSTGVTILAIGTSGAIVDAIISVQQGTSALLPDGLVSPIRRAVRAFNDMAAQADVVEALGPRGEQMSIVFNRWHESALFGMGPGNFSHVTGNRHEVHNTYLGLLAENGLIGILLFLLMVTIIFFKLCMLRTRSRNDNVLRAMLIFLLSIILFYAAASFGIRQRTFWIAIGCCIAYINIMSKRYFLGSERQIGQLRLGNIP